MLVPILSKNATGFTVLPRSSIEVTYFIYKQYDDPVSSQTDESDAKRKAILLVKIFPQPLTKLCVTGPG